MLAVALLVAVLVAPISTHTWASTAVTVAIGLVAVGFALRGRRVGVRTPVTARAAAPWAVALGGIAALELGALAYDDRLAFPTISWLVGPEFVDPAVRLVGYVVWICAGYWLVRR